MSATWDEEKNAINKAKHDLSFEEARALFEGGADFLEIFDEAHSIDEDRFIAIGPVERGVIVVVWTELDEDVIRIISARFATASERDHYLAFIGGFK